MRGGTSNIQDRTSSIEIGGRCALFGMIGGMCVAAGLLGCGAKHTATGQQVSGRGSATRPVIAAGATPSTRPARVYTANEINKSIERGVEFLVTSQNKNGSWGTGTITRGWEVYSMVPGSHDAFRVATTALCVMALREVGEKSAHDNGVEYLITHGQAKRDDSDLMYNVWAHAYALQALAGEMKTNKDPRLKASAKWQLDYMTRYETYTGGWNYYDFDAGTQQPSMGPTSFGTAAGLVALWEAKEAGIELPAKMVERSLRRLEEMRLGNGAYLYGSDYKYIPRLPANMVRGSVGRTQACNYALALWGSKRIDDKKIRDGLEVFDREHNFIQMGRKRPMPHESWYQTAAYYYYFGHYYTARLVELLPEGERAKFMRPVIDGIIQYQEPDGSWWDFAMWDYHKPYGTAFSVMALIRAR